MAEALDHRTLDRNEWPDFVMRWTKSERMKVRRERACAFGLCCFLSASAMTPAKAQSDGAASSCADIRAQLEEAQQYVHRNNLPRAIQVLRLAFDACPRSSAAGVELTKAYVAARAFREAERTAKKVLEIDPDSEAAQFLLAYSYFMQERFAETGKLLGPLLARHPENAGAHKLMGLTLFFYKEYVTAERELSIAHQKDPDDREAFYYLGRVYYTQNNFPPAVQVFSSLIALDPDDYKSSDNLALCYEAMGRNREAEALFKKAQESTKKKNAAYDWPYANLAELLIKQDRAPEAISYASQALQIAPHSARNSYLFGKALAAKGEPEASIPYFQQAIDLDSNYPEPHYALGQAYQKLHEAEKAQHEFELFEQIKKRLPAKKQ